MHKNATKCNETIGNWCKNKHGASKIIDTFETYQGAPLKHKTGAWVIQDWRKKLQRGATGVISTPSDDSTFITMMKRE
jgi:hypothetical protein